MSQHLYRWICCQLGAREHYAIPRALQRNGQLIALLTDAWVFPNSPISRLPSVRLQGRFHPDLNTAKIYHNTSWLIGFELRQKFLKSSKWDLIIARNTWFQQQVVKRLEQMSSALYRLEHPPVIFAYSYAALEIFQYAKHHNWTTVLGQIDPGPIEEQIVARLHQEVGIPSTQWQPAPVSYWKNWHHECDLADYIVVNSAWSKQALLQAKVKKEKIQVIPLAYWPPKKSISFQRKYPESFTIERPLRVLFLGQVNLRKGILPLLQALDSLTGIPIELWVVGNVQIKIPHKWLSHPQIRWIGSVPRCEVDDYYCQADLFILPTYSDGFALTQLEASAWKLPSIVSSYCGEVVKHKINGLILPEVNDSYIVGALKFYLEHPWELSNMSEKTMITEFSLKNLGQYISKILTS